MSGKFMKVKRLIVPTITMIIVASQLMGCAATTQNEMLEMINRGEQIEIEVAAPAFAETEQGVESTLDWVQLSDLETNQALREDWDHALMISTAEYGKNGMLFVDASGRHVNNNTLSVAIHNREFQKLFESEDGISKLANGALSNYVDLEVEDEYKAALMAVNGYFNLIPDMEVNYANADSTLQRNEFMTMVFRADTEVQELQSDGSLTNAVGQSDYNIYAQGVVADSYLDLASKSLNNMTYNGSITRAEVVYMLVNRYFESELGAVDIKTTDVKFSDAKDGGNIAEQQKFIENGVAKDYWKSYELTYALTNPDGGLPTDLYKALVVAKQVGILEGTETRWDEAVTRSEAIEFIVNALKNDDSIATFNYTQGEISGYEVTEQETTDTNSSINDETVDGLTQEAEPTPETPEATPTPELTEEQIKASEILKNLTTEERLQLTIEEIEALNNGDTSIFEKNQAEREKAKESGQVKEKTEAEKALEILESLTPDELANLPMNQLMDLLNGDTSSYTGKPTVPSGGSNDSSSYEDVDIPSDDGGDDYSDGGSGDISTAPDFEGIPEEETDRGSM